MCGCICQDYLHSVKKRKSLRFTWLKSEKKIYNGFVKSPTSALCCISQSFNVRKVRFMITKFARLEFELFTKSSKSDFL